MITEDLIDYIKAQRGKNILDTEITLKLAKAGWHSEDIKQGFEKLNPPVVKSLEKKLDSLTQNLGKFNDLNQLVLALDYKYPDAVDQPYMDEFLIKIREKQDIYLSKVWPSAYKIFCPGQKLVNVLGFKLLVI